MPSDDFRTLERQLLAEIATIERQIVTLTADKAALGRVLFNARKREIGHKEVTRSTSIPRLMAENAILAKIDAGPQSGVSVLALQLAAGGAVPNLKTSTFRSHILRLKERGLIEAPTRGVWRRVTDKGATAARSTPSAAPPFAVGDRVEHRLFGLGTVIGPIVATVGPDMSAPGGIVDKGWNVGVAWDDPDRSDGSYGNSALTRLEEKGNE